MIFFCHRKCCFIAKESSLITLVRCEHVVFASLPCSYYCFIALLLQSHDMFHRPVLVVFHYSIAIGSCDAIFHSITIVVFASSHLPMVLFNCTCCSKLCLLLHH